MKKYSMFLAVVFVLMLCGSVIAADDAWTAWKADLSNAEQIQCELVTPAIVNEENKETLGEITDKDWSVGPEDAVLTLLEYADFQCPYCSQAGLLAIEFQAEHPDEVRYVYRHFPLSFHEKAPMAAYAADAAGQQDLFFKAEVFLYENQSKWSGLETLDEFDAWIRENIATAIPELDYDKWTVDYESEEIRAVVDASFDEVAATGIVQGTPTFFANFHAVNFDPVLLEQYIRLFDLQRNYKLECPVRLVEAGKSYRAVLHTIDGDVVIDLLAEEAPDLVSNFMQLAADGWYNGIVFHHVIPGFIAQAGDRSNTGAGLAGYYLADENLNSGAFNTPGAVAMANTGEGKNSSQFFIAMDLNAYYTDSLTEKNEGLSPEEMAEKVSAKINAMDARYPVFGRVAAESMDVLPQIDDATQIDSIEILVK